MPVGALVALVAQTPDVDGHSCALPGVQPGASGAMPFGPPPGKTVPGVPGVGMPMMTAVPPVPVMPGFIILPVPPPPIGPGGIVPPAPLVPPVPGVPALPRPAIPAVVEPPGVAVPPPQPRETVAAVRKETTIDRAVRDMWVPFTPTVAGTRAWVRKFLPGVRFRAAARNLTSRRHRATNGHDHTHATCGDGDGDRQWC